PLVSIRLSHLPPRELCGAVRKSGGVAFGNPTNVDDLGDRDIAPGARNSRGRIAITFVAGKRNETRGEMAEGRLDLLLPAAMPRRIRAEIEPADTDDVEQVASSEHRLARAVRAR